MKRVAIGLVVFLLGCPAPPRPPIYPTDTANCKGACEHLQALRCLEGDTLEDGTTCTKFCEDTQASGHALNPTCIINIKTCGEIETTCAR